MKAPEKSGAAIPIAEVVIVPFEGAPAPVARSLADDLAARGIATRIARPVPLPHAAYAPARGQYRAEPLLACLQGQGRAHVLGLTDRDLFVPNLNFVFGIATPGGACLVSTARLGVGAGDGLFRARLRKEAMHELGHALGLDHCADPGCVMHFSNSLDDTDRKGDACCARCEAAARKATSPPRRS